MFRRLRGLPRDEVLRRPCQDVLQEERLLGRLPVELHGGQHQPLGPPRVPDALAV